MNKPIPTQRVIADLERIIQYSTNADYYLNNKDYLDVAKEAYHIKNHYDDATTGTSRRLQAPHDSANNMEIEYSPIAQRDLAVELAAIHKESARIIRHFNANRPAAAQRILSDMSHNITSMMRIVDRYILDIGY